MALSASPPDGGWGWVVVAAAFIVNFIMDGVRYSFGLLYLEFHDYFSGSRGAIGWVGGIMFGLLLIAAPVSGALVKKFGCRVVMVSGSAAVSLAFLLGGFAMNVPYLCATVGVIGGIGFSMMFVTYYVALIQYFDRRRSLAIGLAVTGSGLGGFAFNPLTNFLLELYTWRGTMLILSGIILNGVICGMVMIPVERPNSSKFYETTDRQLFTKETELQLDCVKERQESVPLSNNVKDDDDFVDANISNSAPNVNTKHSHKSKIVSFLSNIFMFSLLSNKSFLVFAGFEIAVNISYMVPFMYIPDMSLLNIDNVSRREIVWLANAMSLANVVSRVPVGVFADRPRTNNVQLMAALCMVAGVSCIVMPFCREYGLLMTACCGYAAGIISAMVLIPVVLSELFGEEFVANSFGISLFFGGVSGLIGTPFAGWLVDLTNAYTLTLILAGAEFVVGGLLLLFIPHVKP